MTWLSQLAYETDEPKKIEAILRIWKLRLVEEVISTELRSVLPMASTHAFVAAGRDAHAAGRRRLDGKEPSVSLAEEDGAVERAVSKTSPL
jgi:hypothetical protein